MHRFLKKAPAEAELEDFALKTDMKRGAALGKLNVNVNGLLRRS